MNVFKRIARYIVYFDRLRYYLSLGQFTLVLFIAVKQGLPWQVIPVLFLAAPILLYFDIKYIFGEEQAYRLSKNNEWRRIFNED